MRRLIRWTVCGILGIWLVGTCVPAQAAPRFRLHPRFHPRYSRPFGYARYHRFPYITARMLAYGGYGGGYAGYGGYSDYISTNGQGYWTDTVITKQPPQPPNLVDALGLPNHNGMLDWPLGLQRVAAASGRAAPANRRPGGPGGGTDGEWQGKLRGRQGCDPGGG